MPGAMLQTPSQTKSVLIENPILPVTVKTQLTVMI